MSEVFIPPYPRPHKNKLSRVARFYEGWRSWIHTLYEKSYHMKMGEIRLPGIHFFIPNQSHLTTQILDDPKKYPKHALLHEVLKPLIGDSVFSINGETWKNARAMMNPAFAHTRLQRAFANMDGAAMTMVERIRRTDLSKPVMIDPIMTHVTADIIFRTIFSSELSQADAEKIFMAFERYQAYVQPTMLLRSYGLPIGFLQRKLDAAAAIIHESFAPVVKARHASFHAGNEGPEDILQALLQAKHPVKGEAFTEKELIDQVAIIFLAGHETSASALSWSFYLIASCPHLQDALRKEATAQALSAESLRYLEQIKNVFKETLRLYPPVSFLMREVTEPTLMRDKPIKPGDLLVISPWLLQRNPENFPCPHAFMPERFDDPAQQEACKNAYLPFGRGPRVCIGAGFAQQEAMLIIARMLEHYRLSVPAGFVPQPVSRLTLRAKKGIMLQISPVEK
jgi:cytochrome P450